MKRYLVEFIGKLFLVLTIGGTVVLGAPGSIAPRAVARCGWIMRSLTFRDCIAAPAMTVFTFINPEGR